MSESTEKIITRQQPGIQGCLVVLTHAKGRALHVKMCVSHKNSPHPPFTPPLPLLLHKISVHKQKDSWSTLFNPLTHCSDCTGTQSNASGATVGSVERWYHRVGQTLFCVNCAFLYLQRNYVETNEAEHWLSLFFFFSYSCKGSFEWHWNTMWLLRNITRMHPCNGQLVFWVARSKVWLYFEW